MDACLFAYMLFVIVLLSPRGDRINPVVLECCERTHSNGN